MQNVSNVFIGLATREHRAEVKLIIDDIYTFGHESLISMKTYLDTFEGGGPVVGGCRSAQIDIVMVNPTTITIPRMAKLRPYIRLTDGKITSEWIPKGVFYIDTRSVNDVGILTIHGYDAMLKTEKVMYATEGEMGNWPRRDLTVVNEIISRILDDEFSLDERTEDILTERFQVDYPGFGEEGLTLREVLGYIAAAYAGNWIITDEGNLRLIQLNSQPKADILGSEDHDEIRFGGIRIIV